MKKGITVIVLCPPPPKGGNNEGVCEMKKGLMLLFFFFIGNIFVFGGGGQEPSWVKVEGVKVEGSDFLIDIDRKGIIAGYDGWDTDIVIPTQIDGVEITAIGNGAFMNMGLTSVTIPANTTIGIEAFSGNKLTRLAIPDGVTIGSSAFSSNQIASLTVGNRVNIGSEAFSGNRLTAFVIPDEVIIGNSAFSSNQLTSLTVGNKVFIGNSAFSSNRITTLTIGNNVSIGSSAFSGNQITNLTIGNNGFIDRGIFGESMYYDYMSNDRKAGTYNASARYTAKTEGDYQYIETRYGAVITRYSGSEGNRLQIPRTMGGVAVKGFGREAFAGKSISRMQLPDGLLFIDEIAFRNNQLTSVTIPNSVTYIGNEAFRNNQLTDVTIGNSVTSIGSFVFADNPMTSVNIPDSVTFIGAFPANQLPNINAGNRRIVTIDMWDSYGDSWNGDGALRINVVGAYFFSTKAEGSNSKAYLILGSGAEVVFHWVEGSSQGENAFAVYYNNNPPNPSFNPRSGAVDLNRVLLYRQYGSLENTPNGELLGSFTVP
jgi:serine acetyltransferase